MVSKKQFFFFAYPVKIQEIASSVIALEWKTRATREPDFFRNGDKNSGFCIVMTHTRDDAHGFLLISLEFSRYYNSSMAKN
jgi:hypothetical protein